MWELDCKESWALKNWCFWTVMLEKTLESPLDCKEITPVHSKGDQSWVFFGRNDAKAETPILWPPHAKSWLIGKDSDSGRDLGQEEKGTTEDEMTGWPRRLDGREFEWTPGVGDGQGGLAWCNSWGRKESDTMNDWSEHLIWTRNKTSGDDGITAEIFQILKHDAVKVLDSICHQFWKSQQWPQDKKRSVFISIPKTGNAEECSNYYTIALISHASKFMLKVLQARLQDYMSLELPDVQAGFRKGRGTRGQIANIHWITAKGREFQKYI